ncbi:histidine kinase [Streptomyces filamentosus]|uniref:histidine kinase n=3 Tax=Streptomyces TaxID=1883 RepID=A0ABY4V3B2_STRFL|nr:histidine kinase [Streptomyces filamentosus]USC49154.1 histidine kinase [Streptomyces filamentosus]
MSAAVSRPGCVRRVRRFRVFRGLHRVRRVRTGPALADGALVAAVGAELLTVVGEVGRLTLAGYVLAVGALAVRRRRPLLVVLATVPAAMTGYLWLAPMFALGTAARLVRSGALVGAAAAAVFVAAAAPLAYEIQRTGRAGSPAVLAAGLLGPALLAAGPTLLGRVARSRRALAERLTEARAALAREHRLAEERAAVAERARLAREMHDIVSHHVSRIAVEAGALSVTAATPEARRAGVRIGRISSLAMTELRDTLGVLRARETAVSGPGSLADLPSLVAGSGVDASVTDRVPASAELGAETEYAAYRTVQEALTNIVRHAPGARAEVVLALRDDVLLVEVTNGPPAGGAPVTGALDLGEGPGLGAGPGLGLVGLRERAALLGGSLKAGPAGDGFLVRARLPRSATAPGG